MAAEQGLEAEAFARLYAQHYRVISAYCARRLGSAGAEEAVAEVFLVAWRRWSELEEPGLAWLYTTAQHVIANQLRGDRRRDSAVQHLVTLARSAAPGTDEASAERVAAARALLGLTEQDRAVLLAVAWDGLSATELAATLGCTAATAYVRLHRARRRLDALIRADEQFTEARVEQTR